MSNEFGANKTIPWIFGFGLAFILLGEFLLSRDPSFPGWINMDYERVDLYLGQWVQFGGFALGIITFIVIGVSKLAKSDTPVVAQTERKIRPEKVKDFFTKYSSWNTIGVFGGVGLIGYVASSFLPGFPAWAEMIFGMMLWTGGAFLIWRLFVRE